MYKIDSNKPFTKSLLEAGDPILTAICNHSVILSLGGRGQLLREDLIKARNNFYIQDYFYMVYGSKLVDNFLLDTSSDLCLVNKLRKQKQFLLSSDNPLYLAVEKLTLNQSPMSSEDNPFLSKTVKSLRDEIENLDISVAGNLPNQATQNYIIFKIQTAFRGELESLVVSFACTYNFYKINLFLSKSLSRIREYNQDPIASELKNWFYFLTDPNSELYFETYEKLINNLFNRMNITDSNKIKQLHTLFVEACALEYLFFDSLIS